MLIPSFLSLIGCSESNQDPSAESSDLSASEKAALARNDFEKEAAIKKKFLEDMKNLNNSLRAVKATCVDGYKAETSHPNDFGLVWRECHYDKTKRQYNLGLEFSNRRSFPAWDPEYYATVNCQKKEITARENKHGTFFDDFNISVGDGWFDDYQFSDLTPEVIDKFEVLCSKSDEAD